MRLESSLEVYQQKFEPFYIQECLEFYSSVFSLKSGGEPLSAQLQQA